MLFAAIVNKGNSELQAFPLEAQKPHTLIGEEAGLAANSLAESAVDCGRPREGSAEVNELHQDLTPVVVTSLPGMFARRAFAIISFVPLLASMSSWKAIRYSGLPSVSI